MADHIGSPKRSPFLSALWLFMAVNATALSLAAIATWQASQMGFAAAPAESLQLILAMTACVALPLATLAAQHTLDLESLKNMLRELDPIDELTGLLNRRFFEIIIKDELIRMERTLRPSAIAIFEVDQFTAVKARHGRSFSNHVLRQVSIVAHAQLRGPFDKVSRWTDDSFIVLLNDVSIAQAERICERLKDCVSETVMDYRGKSAFVTLSFGVTSFGPGAQMDDILERASAGLEMATRYGGNKVCNGR